MNIKKTHDQKLELQVITTNSSSLHTNHAIIKGVQGPIMSTFADQEIRYRGT